MDTYELLTKIGEAFNGKGGSTEKYVYLVENGLDNPEYLGVVISNVRDSVGRSVACDYFAFLSRDDFESGKTHADRKEVFARYLSGDKLTTEEFKIIENIERGIYG